MCCLPMGCIVFTKDLQVRSVALIVLDKISDRRSRDH